MPPSIHSLDPWLVEDPRKLDARTLPLHFMRRQADPGQCGAILWGGVVPSARSAVIRQQWILSDDHALFRYLPCTKEHRPSGRAIIFDTSRRHILVERNSGAREKYVAFPGGGIARGETLEECISREFREEFARTIRDLEFLFLAEDFMPFEGEYLHAIELYCQVRLVLDEVHSQLEGCDFPWLEVAELGEVDLRPAIVRDRIVDGTYPQVRHLVSRE
jgi:8-oxo-dGTP pyrophosphatase MutT (NUDIX family)